jgi:hypothetical protein
MITSRYGKSVVIGTTDLDVAITNQCGRLIANVIIAYNNILLSALLERQAAGEIASPLNAHASSNRRHL